MANRNKPIPAQVRTAQRADAALARHLNWQKWPLARQLAYLFSAEAATGIATRVEPHSVLAELYRHCVATRSSNEQWRIRHFLTQLAQCRTALLCRPELVPALAHIGLHYASRVRKLSAWQPPSKNAFYQLDSLLRHLFDQYGDVPAWVLGGWGSNPDRHAGLDLTQLALHLGRGQAMRRFVGWPVSLTKRQEHALRQAPAGCTFQEAYRYVQLAERDATEWLGVALDSRLGREPIGPDDALWLAVLDLFRAEPDVDPWQFGPVCDWIHFRRHVGSPAEPAQPGFSLKGRSLASLLAHTASWHRTLGKISRNPHYMKLLESTWPGLPVPDFAGGEGSWVQVRRLRDYPALLEEGQRMHHCVASYQRSCQQGRNGIFSLTFNGARMLTLQLTAARQLVQVRGKYNRRASPEEQRWVHQWLAEARLTVSEYAWEE
jgi:hypothetical protein